MDKWIDRLLEAALVLLLLFALAQAIQIAGLKKRAGDATVALAQVVDERAQLTEEPRPYPHKQIHLA